MLSFLPGAAAFAAAGAVAALGPIVIHLLNRRRYRVVQWAAMDFLLEALQRNKRILQIRDLLLLLVRTTCVLLFGLAMARPFFSSAAASSNPNQPVHAVVIVDNSLSMGYERLSGTLLDEARAEARKFIERLPQGSRTTVLPLCGSAAVFSRDAYRTPEDARDALERIDVVDRAGTAAMAADLAVEACQSAPELKSKRVVFFGDQQKVNWPAGSLAEHLKSLPELQVVHVGATDVENAWIADFRLQDEVADVETPAQFLVTVRYEGTAPRPNVPVSLLVSGTEVASQSVDLEPGQSREVRFAYRFDLPVEPGRTEFVPVAAQLPPDRLRGDDARHLAVPVVAALPVLFVDQYGERENPQQNQYGETLPLRRLLSPVASRGDLARELVQIRRTTIDQVDRQALEHVRLVVIAGVERPGVAVPVLRDFVEQGGQVLIAAGGAFDPQGWTADGWLEGAGILPLPLDAQPVGKTPDEAVRELEPFFLNPETMVADYFYVEESSRSELADLYRTPLFFKAVAAKTDDDLRRTLLESDTRRLSERRAAVGEIDIRRAQLQDKQGRGSLSPDEQRQLTDDEARRAELDPQWLTWSSDLPRRETDLDPTELARQQQPRVLAAYTSRLPYLVERKVGRGGVLFCSSGLQSNWNNLVRTNAVLIFDRLLRGQLARTLPERNSAAAAELVLPIAATERKLEFTLIRPGDRQESLAVDALGSDGYGLTLRHLAERGVYTVIAARLPAVGGEGGGAADKVWERVVAVNGPASESELASIGPAELRERMGEANYRWLEAGEEVSLEGAQIYGQNLWKWLMAAVVLLLLLELLIIAWPQATKELMMTGPLAGERA